MERLSDFQIREYLQSRRALVVTPLAATGRIARDSLLQLGCRSVSVTDSVVKARALLNQEPVHILVTELQFAEGSASELIELQTTQFNDRSGIAALVLTSDPSGAIAAQIIETDAEAALLKPLRPEALKTALSRCLLNKVVPTPYWSTIERGKALLNARRMDEAMQEFHASTSLSVTPTLAFYYLGEIQSRQGSYEDAVRFFERGLSVDPIDYRCLNGILDARIRSKDHPAAYLAAGRVHAHYPVSAKRVSDLVKLSVFTRRYDDIHDYYEIFKRVEQKDEPLTKTLVAGMLVCSKSFALRGDSVRSAEILREAAKVSLERRVLCADVLRYSLETGNPTEGVLFHANLPEAVTKLPQVTRQVIELMHASENHPEVIRLGSDLIRRTSPVRRDYELLIAASEKIGRSSEIIEGLRTAMAGLPST